MQTKQILSRDSSFYSTLVIVNVSIDNVGYIIYGVRGTHTEQAIVLFHLLSLHIYLYCASHNLWQWEL